MNSEFTININDIQILVARKNIKNVSLRITPPNADVKISVPLHFNTTEIEKIISSKINWIEKHREKVIRKSESTLKPTPEIYRNYYNSFIPIFEKWERITGIKTNKVRLRVMRSCWGSCRSNTRSLTFNLNLVTKPLECTEYVIIHELCHVIHPNHSPEFWRLVEKYCPDYRRIRALLNK